MKYPVSAGVYKYLPSGLKHDALVIDSMVDMTTEDIYM